MHLVERVVQRGTVQTPFWRATIMQSSDDLLSCIAAFREADGAVEVVIQVLWQIGANRVEFHSGPSGYHVNLS